MRARGVDFASTDRVSAVLSSHFLRRLRACIPKMVQTLSFSADRTGLDGFAGFYASPGCWAGPLGCRWGHGRRRFPRPEHDPQRGAHPASLWQAHGRCRPWCGLDRRRVLSCLPPAGDQTPLTFSNLPQDMSSSLTSTRTCLRRVASARRAPASRSLPRRSTQWGTQRALQPSRHLLAASVPAFPAL